MHAITLAGLWLALARTGLDPGQRIRTWLAIAIPFTLWLALIWVLAADGTFVPRPGVPAIPLAVVLPLIVALPFLLRSGNLGAALDAAPAYWLVALQVYRMLGGVFLVGWYQSEIPAVFALPAGIGDILVGMLALPVASFLAAGAASSRRLAIAWNVLGLIDFTVAVGIGVLSAPGPMQLIVPDRPNPGLGLFPMVMIPVFTVPASILLHALSIRQLLRRS